MSPVELLVVISAAVGWIATALKASDLRRSPDDRGLRSMVAAMAGLSAAFTIEIPTLYHGIGSWTGVADLSRLLVHSLILVASCAVQTMLIHWAYEHDVAARKAPRRWIGLAVALVGLIILFSLDPTRDQVVDVPNRFDRPNLVLTFYSLVFYLFLTFSMAETWRDAWRYTRQTRSFFRAGLWCIGTTGLIGTIFGLHQTAYLVLRAAGSDVTWPRNAIGNGLALAAVVSLALGVALPTVGARAAEIPRRRRQRRVLAQLEPVWQDLHELFPEVVFAPQHEADPGRAPGTRLYRRFIEIADARLQLRPYLDHTVAERARAAAAKHGLGEEQQAVVAEAAQLACAVEAARNSDTGLAAPYKRPKRDPGREQDFARELGHLQQVADAYAHSPIVAIQLAAYRAELDTESTTNS